MREKFILSRDAGNRNEVIKVIRRTITVEDSINAFINSIRGQLLMKHNIELDYTSAMNMLATFGIKYMSKTENLSDEDMIIVKKYLFGADELKFKSIEDQLLETFLSRKLPGLVEVATAKLHETSNPTT